MPELLTQEPCERGQLAAFKSERWPASARNDGRLEVGKPGRIESESTAYGKRLGIEGATIARAHQAMVEALFSKNAHLEVTVA